MSNEILDTLSAPELQELLNSVSSANARDLVERDLLRRRSEIELELSSLTAARDEAVANKRAADDRVLQRLETRWHRVRLNSSLSVLGFCVLGAIFNVFVSLPEGLHLLDSWQSPFTSGWIPATAWIVFYAAVVTIVFETDFFLRRIPKRRLRFRREEKIWDLQEAVNNTQATRNKHFVALIRDHITEILNSSRGPQFGSSLRVRADTTSGKRERITLGVGLSEVTNDDNRVSTDVQQSLVQLLGSLPGGSIGISGPRGVGKSSLLTALCGANPTINGRRAIAINTSAPVEYDAREFLLHLFSSLCRQVLRTEGHEDAIEADRGAILEARRWQRASILNAIQPLVRWLLLAGVTLAVIAFMLATLQSWAANSSSALAISTDEAVVKTSLATPAQVHASAKPKPLTSGRQNGAQVGSSSSPASDLDAGDVSNRMLDILKILIPMPLFTIGVVAFVLGFMGLIGFGPFRRILFRPEPYSQFNFGPDRPELVNRAVHELRNIGFQRSYTSGWSGGLKVPAGLDITSSAGLTLAQQSESLPELVERFRSFVREVARVYDNAVLIGIDELDKLKSAQQAEAFLNGVKSVFGIPRCFYLISVSEHALAAFERRGIGFRDAFDSALDDIVQVDFLDLNQSRVMLNRRILRLPDPFVQLCHMLSGGLPRDLIRHARALLVYADGTPKGMVSLKGAVNHMAALDLAARLRATSITIRTVKEVAETSELLVKVSRLPAATTIKDATTAIRQFRAYLAEQEKLRESEEGRVLLRLSEELAIYYEMIILLRRVTGLLSSQHGWERATAMGFAEQVARVRQALEVGVPLANVRVTELRKAVDEKGPAIDRKVNPHLYSPRI